MGTKLLKPGFTPKKLKCIELMARGNITQGKIAKDINVNESTISKWKKDRAFMQAVLDRARVILKDSMPEVYASLADASKAGSSRHIKIFLEHIEKLESIRAGQASITFTWNPTTHTVPGDADA